VRQAEADTGKRKELKALRGEERELHRANDIPKSASAFSPPSSTHAERSELLNRGAQGALRGRADLQGLGGVGLRLLRARQGQTL
jgi:hypothetical protein